MLKAIKLYKKKSNQVLLDHVSFHLGDKGIITFVGPNGAGKSTLFKSLMGLVRLDSGTVFVEDVDMSHRMKQMPSFVSFISDLQMLRDALTARDHLRLFRQIHHIPKKVEEELIEMLNMSHYLDKRVESFSLGMRQALLIALSFMHQGRIIILDEPMTGLDPLRREQLTQYLLEQSESKLILISSHIISDIFHLADECFFIRKGALIYHQHMESLRDKEWILEFSKDHILGGRKFQAHHRYLLQEEEIAKIKAEHSDVVLLSPVDRRKIFEEKFFSYYEGEK